jgi:hypothetical protein
MGGSERLIRRGKEIEKRERMKEGVNRKEGEEGCSQAKGIGMGGGGNLAQAS